MNIRKARLNDIVLKSTDLIVMVRDVYIISVQFLVTVFV